MVSFSGRPIVLVAGGIAIGVMVGWAMFSRPPQPQPTQADPPRSSAHEQVATTVPASQDPSDPVDPKAAGQTEPEMQPDRQPTVASAPRQTNVYPLLPEGLRPDAAGDPAVYARVPGLPTPIINRDGRDMTAEVKSLLQVQHDPQPFPGTANSPPVKAVPFPKNQEEMDRMVQELNQKAQEANPQAQEAASPPPQ